ncbi:MerR family transcriptional regulator [Atlantibacter sp.]|uniref:MerR family transcriptional regulator n=1 Tax=Atlantibacter sp. TaxID=1903473 RepID=UPI0028AEA33B|nr:MerR family transcriptional regulator [Atlantibacter sp.]
MALYTIGEVAELCDINPVTLRAWQRRYGLVKPQRTDGGHRLFNESDIDRIREIKQWVDNGVQVSKVKSLLLTDAQDPGSQWYQMQETLLRLLRAGNINRVRNWVSETGRDYPAQTLVDKLFIPLRHRLLSQQAALATLLSILDGVLINYIALCLSSARKKSGKDALVIGWNITDTTRLWLAGWSATQRGWRVSILAHPVTQLRPEIFEGQTLLVWCGDNPTSQQRTQLAQWREDGRAIIDLNTPEAL